MASFRPLQKSNVVAENIAEHLLDMVKSGALNPGDRLPPERELSELLDVSRTSLREALRALSIMRVVEVRQGAGTFITALDPRELLEHLDFVFELDQVALHELFEVRQIFEVGAVRLAATRIDESQVAAIAAIAQRSEANVDDAAAFLQADLDLHDAITRASGNTLLMRLMASISQLGQASRKVTGGLGEVRRRTIKDHHAIIAALRTRNPDQAGAAMLRHLENVEQAYLARDDQNDPKEENRSP